MTDTAPEIRKGRKFDQVLQGARTVFLRDGFEGASVDDIAREAGVSKATLYSYFPDKRLLFMEVAKTECARQAEEAVQTINMNAPAAEVMATIGHHILRISLSDFGRQMYRISVAESDRFPELGRQFYASGPQLIRERVGYYLRHAVAQGQFRIEDFDMAADQFAALCKSDLHNRMVCGLHDGYSDADMSRSVKAAVAMFMAMYGVKG